MIARPAPLLLALAAVGAALLLAARVGAQPTEADVFVAEGILALEDKRYDEALRHFSIALQREPDHIEALYYSGVALMAQNKPGEAAPFLERARQRSPGEVSIAYQLGLAYFALNDDVRAEPLLEEVFRREPTLDSLGYYVGVLRYRQGNPQAALQALRAGRTTDPTIAHLTRVYAGLALAAMGLPGHAAAEVEQALRLQPASPLTGPVERLRETFAQSRASERRFRIDARFGFFYDDNATNRPEKETDDDTVVALRHPDYQTTGELFTLRLEYDWFKRGPWTSTAGYTFFTTYNNDLPSFNIIDHLVMLGATHHGLLGTMPLIVGAQYVFESLLLDEKELLRRHAFSLMSTLVASPRHLTHAIVKVEVKEYSGVRPLDREEPQDGKNVMIGLLHLVRFSQDRHLIKAGYQFDVEDSRGMNLEYLGHRFLAGAQYTLPWHGIRLVYDFGLHYRDYQNKHTLFPEDNPDTRERSDHEYSHLFRIEVPLPGNFTLGADYQGTIAKSNLAPFTYRRNIYTVSVSWSY